MFPFPPFPAPIISGGRAGGGKEGRKEGKGEEEVMRLFFIPAEEGRNFEPELGLRRREGDKGKRALAGS